MSQQTVLIIDDEPDIRELLEITIGRMGFETRSADSLQSARALLERQPFQLCLTDMNLPDGTGLELIAHIQKVQPDTPVSVITAYGSMELAIESLKAGAFDFISKPIDLDRLRSLVSNALRLEYRNATVENESEVQLLGEAPQIQALRGQINKLARSQAPVYISGESGSGKEVVARLIHARGPRSDGPFVPVNCGAIPSELVESELFGHVKGSFTGAYSDKAGLFEAANGGTLFLDEVADLPLAMQVKLLRAIQEKTVRRVGSSKETAVDVRILSATHKDLAQQVEAGHFRTDLFYRINVIEVKVPSLRDRKQDIPLLADFMLARLASDWQIDAPQFSDEARSALLHYPFPGNVRELENVIERAVTLQEGQQIQAADLQLPGVAGSVSVTVTEADNDSNAAMGDLEGYLERKEKDALAAALEQANWNRTEAAKLLGISFRQLRYRLKKLGLEPEE